MKKSISNDIEPEILNNQNKKNHLKLSKTYPAYLILILFIAISIILFFNVKSTLYTIRKADFDNSVNSVISRLDNGLNQHFDVINSMSGIYDLQEGGIVREYFELSAALPAQTHSSIISINFIPKVFKNELEFHIFDAKSSGYYEYRVFPSGSREVYYPVQHTVPLERNLKIQGLDLSTLKEYKDLFSISEYTGNPKATVFFKIRPNTLGFSVILPAYKYKSFRSTEQERKKNILGFIGIDIKSEDFFNLAINGSEESTKKIVPSDSLIVYQIKQDNLKDILYKSQNFNTYKKDKNTIHSEISYRIFNQHIDIDFYSTPNLGGKFQSSLPVLLLIVSLILSFALFGFILSLITTRSIALDLAERMTRSQRRIVDTSQDIIGVLDFDGNWKSINNAAFDVFGKPQSEILKTNFLDMLLDEQKEEYLKVIKKHINSENLDEEITERIDLLMIGAEDKHLCLEWSLAISSIDKLIYAIGRNVSSEKEAQFESLIKSKQIELSEQFIREKNIENYNYMLDLSHQIRNNLTSVLGYLQFLKEDMYDSAEEMKEFIVSSYDESEKLFRLVADTIDKGLISAIDTQKIENINLIEIINYLIEFNKKKAQFTFEFESLDKLTAFADKEQLENIFNELINIMSHKSKDNKIEFDVKYSNKEAIIKMIGTSDSVLTNLIKLMESDENITTKLKLDKDDVILNLVKCKSKLRAMKCDLNIDIDETGVGSNIFIVSLPTLRTSIE